MKKEFLSSIIAGFFIGVAGWMYLSSPNKIVGAVLFSIGLIMVLLTKTNLVTGKFGSCTYTKEGFELLFTILIGNIIGAEIVSILSSIIPTIQINLEGIINARNEVLPHEALVKAIGCGILIEIAVWSWKNDYKAGVLFCVPGFILSGFYHCVADAYYYMCDVSLLNTNTLITWLITVIGNFIGSQWRFLSNKFLGANL